MEEKIYGRSVNKTGLALRLIDSKAIEKSFSAKELADFQQFDTWVQCDKCEKWRMLTGSAEDLPEQWFCELNTDHHNHRCDLPERDQAWYYNLFKNGFSTSPQKQKAESEQPKHQPEDDDELLFHLLSITESEKGTSLISRHYCHDSLLQTRNDGEEVEHARILLENEVAVKEQSAKESQVPSAANPIETVPSFDFLQANETGVIDHNIKKSQVPSTANLMNGRSLASLLANETDAMDSNSKEPQVRSTANPIETGRSLASLLANETDVVDSNSQEPQVSSTTNPIETGRSLSPVLADSSNSLTEDVYSSEKKRDVSEKKDDATELLDKKPVHQSLSRSPQIIDLCGSSDDDL